MLLWFRRITVAALVLAVALLGGLIASARVLRTPAGVHRSLALLLPGNGTIEVPIYAGTGDTVMLAGHLDGPIVRRTGDGRWAARWFCERTVREQSGVGDTLVIPCAGTIHRFPLHTAVTPNAEGPLPDTLVVLSDLEGNDRFLQQALERLSITDASGQWRFGRGHLVILGDVVDRGRDVFPLLWRLHRLAGEAAAAGGAVRLVLGNHEQYALRGNISRANREHLYALRALGGPSAAFSAGTVLGDWLRDQPVALRLGAVLFVHGGISPAVVEAGATIGSLNAAMRDYWADSTAAPARTAARDAVLGLRGVTQYRGLIAAVPEQYDTATTAQVEAIRRAFGVEHIVVAHTIVDRVEPRYNGAVYAVDVNAPASASEALAFVQGTPRVLPVGIPRGLEESPVEARRWRPTSAADRALLRATLDAMRELQRLPFPY